MHDFTFKLLRPFELWKNGNTKNPTGNHHKLKLFQNNFLILSISNDIISLLIFCFFINSYNFSIEINKLQKIIFLRIIVEIFHHRTRRWINRWLIRPRKTSKWARVLWYVCCHLFPNSSCLWIPYSSHFIISLKPTRLKSII